MTLLRRREALKLAAAGVAVAAVTPSAFAGLRSRVRGPRTEVRRHFGELVFETVIPRTTRLAEAPSFGKPIIHYDKYSAGASAYEVLAEELAKRLKL